MIKHLPGNVIYLNVARWWLTGFLFFVPFQLNVIKFIKGWNNELITFIHRLDEITILLFTFLAFIEFYKNRERNNYLYLVLIVPMFLISVFGILSGIINGNSMFITLLGIFDFIKVFLVIFIYAAFFKEYNQFKRIFRFLLIMAVIMGVIGIVQEIWALVSVYVLGKSKYDMGVYLLRAGASINQDSGYWRFGIYRASSLMHYSSYIGLYSLLFLTIYVNTAKKFKYSVLFPLFAMIATSLSRKIYACFMVLAGYQLLAGRKKILFLLIPVLIVLVVMAFLPDYNLSKYFNIPILKNLEITNVNNDTRGISFREYTKNKSMEAWEDHPFLGVGPGMFGGIISINYNSHLYEEYNFMRNAFFKQTKGIDQFWPYALAEFGIIGTALFGIFFISLIALLSLLKKRAASMEIRGLFMGLTIFSIEILIWSLGSGFYSSVIFTYFAFVGMCLGFSCNKHDS